MHFDSVPIFAWGAFKVGSNGNLREKWLLSVVHLCQILLL